MLYLSQQDYKKSELAFKKVLEFKPSDFQSLVGLVMVAIQEKEYDIAMDYIAKAEVLDVFSIDLIRLKCFVLERQKKYNEVLTILDETDSIYNVKEFSNVFFSLVKRENIVGT